MVVGTEKRKYIGIKSTVPRQWLLEWVWICATYSLHSDCRGAFYPMALAFASTVAPTTQSPHQITAGVVAIAVASATSAALLDPEQLFQALQLILLLSHVYPCC